MYAGGGVTKVGGLRSHVVLPYLVILVFLLFTILWPTLIAAYHLILSDIFIDLTISNRLSGCGILEGVLWVLTHPLCVLALFQNTSQTTS